MDGMTEYIVEYDQDDLVQGFQCWGDDKDHAIEQCKNYLDHETTKYKILCEREV